MSFIEQILWTITIPSTILLLIQSAMTFTGHFGFDGDTDVDYDVADDHDFGDTVDVSFKLFTFRTLTILFSVAGWASLAMYKSIDIAWLALLIGSLIGFVVMLFVASLFYSFTKLTESGNIEISNAVNKEGEVYLRIPANKEGTGKIQISIQGGIREINALTEGPEIKTGQIVRVIKKLENDSLLVESI